MRDMLLIDEEGRKLTRTKKNTRREDVEWRAVHYLKMTLTMAWGEFVKLHPTFPHSQRTFEKARPVYIRPFRLQNRAMCCCLVHTDFGFLADALTEALKAKGVSKIGDGGGLMRTTFCKKAEDAPFHPLACLTRSCSECGVKLLKNLPVRKSHFN